MERTISVEKVINGLKELHGSQETMKLISDAIVLLKEPEAIEPVVYVDKYKCCSNCGHNLEIQFWLSKNIMLHAFCRICPGCGRRVKWNDNDRY